MSMSTDKRIEMYEEKFSRVVFPLRTTHYDTKMALDLLVQKNHFLDIVRLAFGPLTLAVSTSTRDAGVYWMDEANFDPNSKASIAIFRFLSPGSSLHAIMEHVSVPASDFHTSLKQQWKDVDVRGSPGVKTNNANDVMSYRFDMPLAALCSFSRQIATESRDTDLTSLSKDRVLPLMLIPYWLPPLVTREEPVSKQPQNSLPCTMLGYFMLRLINFVSFRCFNDHRDVLSDRSREQPHWQQVLDDWLAKVTADPLRKVSRSFPAVLKLLSAYSEYYMRPAVLSQLVGRRSLEEITWDLSATMTELLLHAPAALWLRRLSVVSTEVQRQPITDAASIASLTVLVGYLTMLNERLTTTLAQLGAFLPSALPPAAGGVGTSSLAPSAGQEILRLGQSLLRNSVCAIRNATLSYSRVSKCKSEHYEDVIRLWKVLLSWPPAGGAASNSSNSPSGASSSLLIASPTGAHVMQTKETFVLQRYEVYVYLLGDILNMIANSECISSTGESGAKLLSEALSIYQDETVVRVLRDASRHIQQITLGGSNSTVVSRSHAVSATFVQALKQQHVLQWGRADSPWVPLDLHGPEMQQLVARAASTLWRYSQDGTAISKTTQSSSSGASSSSTAAAKQWLAQCHDVLLALVPEARDATEKYKKDCAPSSQQQGIEQTGTLPGVGSTGDELLMGRVSSRSCASKDGLLSEEDRALFLTGKVSACRLDQKTMNLRFPTRHGSLRDVKQSQPTLSCDEFPPLVAVSMCVDDVMECLFMLYYRRYIPRCHRGHALWLLEECGHRCSQHHNKEANWECHTCGVAFCDQCRPLPCDLQRRNNGTTFLSPVVVAPNYKRSCDGCHVVLDVGVRAWGQASDEQDHQGTGGSSNRDMTKIYCASCASRPYKIPSVRVIAAYATWWTISTVMIFLSLLWLLL